MPRKPAEISEFEAQSLRAISQQLDAINRPPDNGDVPIRYATVLTATFTLESDDEIKDGGTFKARNSEGIWMFERVTR